ncbi:MAG: rod shape-determining protein MreC [Clostridiales bacterium]|nr:rod shape-determining protein MreC [Clostridiales bacterium]
MSKNTGKDRTVRILAIVSIVLISIMGITAGQRERITALERWTGNILSPIQGFVMTVSNTIGGEVASIANIKKIKEENKVLTKKIPQLQNEIVTLRLKREELEELRGLIRALNYVNENAEVKPVVADIIAKDPGNWFNIFTVNAGEKHGVRSNSIVLNSKGLIGRVYETGDTWAKVVSIVDNNSSVSFQVLRDGKAQGILSGSITNEISGYLFDPEFEVIVGDKLITSGLGLYPEGIIIGEVTEVHTSSSKLLKTITVEPAVNFNRLTKVLIVTPNNLNNFLEE